MVIEEKFRRDLRRKYLQTFRDLLGLYVINNDYVSSKNVEIFRKFSSKIEKESEKVCEELADVVMNELQSSGLLDELEASKELLDSDEMKNLENRIDQAACEALRKYAKKISLEEGGC